MKLQATAIFFAIICLSGALHAQDTTGIYKARKDTLSSAIHTEAAPGNYLSRYKDIRVETISAAGLCKMACCNLAESFENSASVTVGYSDAVTGARQIKLLGQSGIYTQILDENRPVMRGLSAPFGLNYVPGQWLESIQIAKGVSSVINGVESMTGQINMEHRKPTDEKPFYLQASVMDDTKCDLNLISSLQFDEMKKWSTVILAHVDGNFKAMDGNADGFMDDPRQLQLNLSNRWLYYGEDGVQVRFGVHAIQDRRNGGQMEEFGENRWKADILNRSLNSYVKIGIPVADDGADNIALVLDWTYQNMDSSFGNAYVSGSRHYGYIAGQHSVFANLMYQNDLGESGRFTLGLSDLLDLYDENFSGTVSETVLNDAAVYGEYTYRVGEKFSAILGIRADCYNHGGLKLSPRLTLRYAPSEEWIFRANGGRGLRYSTPLTDNFGVLSTGKAINGDLMSHPLEKSWTAGANATWYLPFDSRGKTYLSVDYFNTTFSEQMLVCNRGTSIDFFTLSSLEDGHSYTNNIQIDFSSEIFKGFTATLTGRYTDARQTLGLSDDIKPMTSLYKGVLNLQYATRLNRWIFDFTASVNGPCRVWDFMGYENNRSETFPLLYAQLTRRFKGFDIYAGAENITGYTQKDPIMGAENPFSTGFDASCVWGPLMGARFYAGIRLTIWKIE